MKAARLHIIGGAMAGSAAIPADHPVPVPAGLSLTDAAGIPIAAGTAWQALDDLAGALRHQASGRARGKIIIAMG